MPGTATLLHPVATLLDGEHAAVFGAPGSGKTRLVVELVADRVERLGYATDEVLVLSATRASATALRDELAVRLGVTTRGPLARTANSLAFQLVRAFTGEPVTLLTGAEHDQIVGELLEGGIRDGFGPAWPDPLTPEVRALRGFRSELRDVMMRAVEHGVDAAALARLGERAARPEWVAAAGFLAEYAEVKEQLRPTQFDSAELGAFAAAIVRRSTVDPEASAALGTLAGLRLLVVDDAQEATEATAALLGGVRRAGRRGRRVRRPRRREQRLPRRPARAARLARRRPRRRPGAPRRCSTACTAAAPPSATSCSRSRRTSARPSAVRIGRRRSRRRGDAAGEAGTDGDPLAPLLGIEAASHAAECQAVAGLLRERHLLDGVPWSSMAVVVRSGADVPAFERGLALADVPTAGDAARTALRDAPAAAALLTAASLVLGRERLTPEVAVEVLTGPLGPPRRGRPPPPPARAAARGARGRGCAGRATSCWSTRSPHRAASRPSMPRPAAAPRGWPSCSPRRGRVAEAGGTIEEVLWSLWEASGLAAEWGAQAKGTGVLAEEANRALDAVVALFAAATRYVEREPDAPAARFVDEVLASELPEDSLAPRRSAETVARHHAAGAHRPGVRRRRRRRPAGRRVAEPAPARHAAARRPAAAGRRRRRAQGRRCRRPRPSPRRARPCAATSSASSRSRPRGRVASSC